MALGRASPAAHGHWCTFTDLYHAIPYMLVPVAAVRFSLFLVAAVVPFGLVGGGGLLEGAGRRVSSANVGF